MDYENLRKKELEQIVEKLVAQRDQPSSERIKYLDRLQVTIANEVPFIFLELLKTECDQEVLIHLCNSLARTKAEEAVMPLVDLLLGNREIEGKDDPLKTEKESYLRVRCAAVKALGILRDERAVIPMMYVLNDKEENYRVRLNVAEALGRIGDSYALNPLINLVADDQESSVYLKESAAKALGMLGDVRAVKPLVSILESKRGIFSKFSFLKERVLEAISKIGPDNDKDTVRALKESLLDEAPSVRLSAVEAISSMGDSSLIKILIPVVFDNEEEDIAREAVRAIYNLEGYLELKNLLEDDKLPGWSRDEIEISLGEG